jgi:hypothetical protein
LIDTTLQKSIEGSIDVEEVVEKVINAYASELGHDIGIALGYRFYEISVGRVVETVNGSVKGFPGVFTGVQGCGEISHQPKSQNDYAMLHF